MNHNTNARKLDRKLLLVDVVALTAALLLALWGRYRFRLEPWQVQLYSIIYALMVLFTVLIHFYRMPRRRNPAIYLLDPFDIFTETFHNQLILLAGMAVFLIFTRSAERVSRLALLYFFLANMVLTYVFRLLYWSWARKHHRQTQPGRSFVVVARAADLPRVCATLQATLPSDERILGAIVIRDEESAGLQLFAADADVPVGAKGKQQANRAFSSSMAGGPAPGVSLPEGSLPAGVQVCGWICAAAKTIHWTNDVPWGTGELPAALEAFVYYPEQRGSAGGNEQRDIAGRNGQRNIAGGNNGQRDIAGRNDQKDIASGKEQSGTTGGNEKKCTPAGNGIKSLTEVFNQIGINVTVALSGSLEEGGDILGKRISHRGCYGVVRFDAMRRRQPVLGVPYVVTDMDTAAAFIKAHMDHLRGEYLCFSNVHTTVMAHDDPAYATIMNEAAYVFPDGMPIARYMRHDNGDANRIPGPDFMEEMFRVTMDGSLSHFFYGSTQETLQLLQEKLPAKYPGIRIAGMYSPPFRALSSEEDRQIVKMINDSGADIVWIGLGAPKQEKWMATHKGQIHAVMAGVGAGFNFHAGNIKRAPYWMQKLGLEWLYRLFQDPKRLFSRYLVTNTKYLWYILTDRK